MGIRQQLWLAVAGLLLVGAGCSVSLVEGLEERAASELVVTLGENHIGATKERTQGENAEFAVRVHRDDVATALALLNEEGLPHRSSPGILEALGEAALVPSKTAEQARWLAGTAGELERTLAELGGVLSARVHLAVPAKQRLSTQSAQSPSASVLIRHRGTTPPMQARAVQSLVAGAVPGLTQEHVAVVLHPVAARAGGPSPALSQLGPLTVARSSAGPLRYALVGVGLVNVLLVLAVVVLWGRLRLAPVAPNKAGSEGAR